MSDARPPITQDDSVPLESIGRWPEAPAPPLPAETNWLAIAALATGTTIGWFPGLGMLPLILGLFGHQFAKQNQGSGAKMAIAGIVLGAASVIWALLLLVAPGTAELTTG